jgi:hypothetical protein
MNLPKKYQPVTICLHMHDINKGLYRKFIKYGLSVVTAGNAFDYRFLERFYKILQNHAFATSNMISSYTALSIEMGIPFFIYGEPQIFINKSDGNLPLGKYDGYSDVPFFKELYDKLQFKDSNGTIDKTIKNAIEKRLGINDTISRRKMCLILWSCLLFRIFRLKNLQKVVKYLIKTKGIK